MNSNLVGNIASGQFGNNNGAIFLHGSPSNLNLTNSVVMNDAEYEIVSSYPEEDINEIYVEYSMVSGR